LAAPDGLLVIDKPAGWTSHDVVARCRRLGGTRKVGHAGTLDPMATGVLVLGIGRATRLLGHLALATKAYEATFRLGQTTVTDDAEGEALASVDASRLRDGEIAAALGAFRGDIDQVPSSVSAVKVAGERAYARVRNGEQVVLRARQVRVSELVLLSTTRDAGFADVAVRVECSSGTYVRALARDLGVALGVGGHLTRLRRTRVGPFTTSAAHDLGDLARQEPGDLPVITLDDVARTCFACHVVAEGQVSAVRNGRPLEIRLERGCDPGGLPLATDPEPPTAAARAPVAVLSPTGRFLALYEQQGSQDQQPPLARPVAVFDPA
jgi:tRNA pseudouridine55 synthase